MTTSPISVRQNGRKSSPRPRRAAAGQKLDVTKVSTTLRLDPDNIAAFRAGGSGWQSRINDALRKAAGLS